MRSPRSRLIPAVLASALILAACGDDNGDTGDAADPTTAGPDDADSTAMAPNGNIDDVDVEFQTSEDDVEVPSLTWEGGAFSEGDLPFVAASTQVRELEEGDGEEVTDAHFVYVKYLLVNGSTGEDLVNSFPGEEDVLFDLTNENLIPGIPSILLGSNVGSRVVAAVPPAEAFGPGGEPSSGIGGEDTLLFYMEVVEAREPLAQAEGEDVEPVEGLPEVEADGTSPAAVTIPEEDAPGELVSQLLIEGEGPEVESGQTITVQYTGVSWSTGETFDTSLREGGAPFSVAIDTGSVIQGWDEGLVGHPVGSRVLLVIPPDMAYAGSGNDLEEETLVFVVDILDAG